MTGLDVVKKNRILFELLNGKEGVACVESKRGNQLSVNHHPIVVNRAVLVNMNDWIITKN